MRNSMTVVAPRESARAERDGPRVRPERVNSPTLLKRRSYRRPPHTDGQGHRGHDHHRAPPAHYAHYDRHASDGGRGVVFSRDAAADVWLNRRHHHRPPCRPARIGHHHHRSVRRSCYTRWWRGWSWYPSFAYVRPSTVYVEQPVTVVDACTTTPGVEGVYVEGSAYDLGHAEPAWVEPSTGLSATVLPQGRDATGAEEFELLRPMQEGDRAFAAGDFAEARRHYVRAQLDGRFYAEATLAYAITRFAEGEYAAAAMGLRRGLEALPDAIDFPIDVTALYAADLAAFGDHVEDLEKHLRAHPGDAGGWMVLGYVRFGSGDALRAVAGFDRALQLAPNDVLYHLLREAAASAMNQVVPPAGDAREGASSLGAVDPARGTGSVLVVPAAPTAEGFSALRSASPDLL